MASADIWFDFETLRHNVKHNTVDRLKQILSGFNEECGTNFIKSGKKQDIIDRITRELDSWRRGNATDKWTKGKAILIQVRDSGGYASSRTGTESYPSSVMPNTHYSAPITPFRSTATPTVIPRFDPYAAPRRATLPTNPAPAVASTSSIPSIRFKTSPFFRVERALSNVVECPESTSQMDRRQQSLSFTMSSDVLQKLSSQSPRYQLRLYCTSSSFYTPTPAFRTNPPCSIEFPPTCEVRVNTVQLQANLKGMKKKPGTAPPPDLGKALRLSVGATNKVEMIYVNSQQPTQSKKYYLVVMLVEVTTVDQLIDRLKKGKYKSSGEILARMIQPASEEDEIIAGHQKMSLKCPLSYMRIATPCRSWTCVHPQCFDAFSWFSLMEQTTTWMCPVCEKILNVEDLIVDGYFDEILESTPEEVEEVIVEPDGQWHTADNVHGSDAWKIAHNNTDATLASAHATKERSPTPMKPVVTEVDRKRTLPSNAEIVILDSDDEDEGRVKRELSPSNDGNGTQRSGLAASGLVARVVPRSQTVDSDVIDLTLDSDEDTPPERPSKKRRVDDRGTLSPTEQIWKKSRVDSVPPAPVTTNTPAVDPASFGLPRTARPPPASVSPTTHRFDPSISAPFAMSHHPLPPRPTPALVPPPTPALNGSYAAPGFGLPRPGGPSSNGLNGGWRR